MRGKWIGDLDEVELVKFRAVLEKNPQLRGRKLAWDGTNILAHMRPPSQLCYEMEPDGTIGPWLQQALDSGEYIDTKDGGYLMLVPVA